MKKTYRIAMESRPGYLYVRISGTISGDSVTGLAKQVVRALAEETADGLMVDVRDLRMSLSPLSTVSLVRSFPKLAGELKVPTAIVYAARAQSVVRFYETVAMNRGYPTWIFPNAKEAEGWLESTQKR